MFTEVIKPCRLLKACCPQRFMHFLKLILKLSTTQFSHNYCHFKTKASTFNQRQRSVSDLQLWLQPSPYSLNAVSPNSVYVFILTNYSSVHRANSGSEQTHLCTSVSLFLVIIWVLKLSLFLQHTNAWRPEGQTLKLTACGRALLHLAHKSKESGTVSREWIKAADSAC